MIVDTAYIGYITTCGQLSWNKFPLKKTLLHLCQPVSMMILEVVSASLILTLIDI